jgi:ABC-type sulfate transport system substrate-binding protein
MSKHLFAGLIVALSPVVALAASQDSASSNAASEASSTLKTPKDQLPIAGVVTSVKGDHLSIMAPSSAESKITQVGNTLTVEKGVNFQTIHGGLGPQARILRDGKKASLTDIKEGDVVHAAYDPNSKSFSDIRAVSSDEFESDQAQAKHDLGTSGSSGTSGMQQK